MITQEVIDEIYKTYKKPPKDKEILNIPYFIDILKDYKLQADNMEILVGNQEEFSPFRRFLIRGLHAILEFDKEVAFVFHDHILFFQKDLPIITVNFKPEEQSLLDKIFGKKR